MGGYSTARPAPATRIARTPAVRRGKPREGFGCWGDGGVAAGMNELPARSTRESSCTFPLLRRPPRHRHWLHLAMASAVAAIHVATARWHTTSCCTIFASDATCETATPQLSPPPPRRKNNSANANHSKEEECLVTTTTATKSPNAKCSKTEENPHRQARH